MKRPGTSQGILALPLARHIQQILVLALTFAVSACNIGGDGEAPGNGGEQQQAEPLRLTVVANSDFHGALEPRVYKTKNAERTVEIGGAALLATYVRIIRERSRGPVVLLDGGDMFQGTLVSNTVEGASVVNFYNSLGVTAAALGNHEFDYGPVGDASVPKDPSDDPRGALKARIAEARFPVLASNVFEEESGEIPDWIKPSVMLTLPAGRGLRSVKVGIVGGATEETPYTTSVPNLVGLRFEELFKHVRREARKLRREGADFVVFTAHAGGSCRDNSIDKLEDLSTCTDDEMFQVLKAMPRGLIDVAVAGHTHQGVIKRVNGTIVLQAFAQAQYVAWAELEKTGRGRKARVRSIVNGPIQLCGEVVHAEKGPSCSGSDLSKHEEVHPAYFLGKEVKPDAETLALLKPDFDRVKAIKEAPLGINALDAFTRSYGSESEMGNLVADLMSVYRDDPVDLALTNNGGLRANFDKGPLRYGDVFNVLPFDNRLAVLKIPGDILFKIVELGARATGGGLSWSRELAFRAAKCVVKEVLVKGEALEPNRVYRVMTNDYLATGGSGFNDLKLTAEQVQMLDNAPALRDHAVAVLKEQGKDIHPLDYFNKDLPRQIIEAPCTAEDLEKLKKPGEGTGRRF